MNRQQAKELLPIIQAFAEGKTIQIKALDGLWHDDNGGDIRFYAKPKNYRIKPLQKYRPFKNKKECWEEMLKHHPFGWVKDMSRMCSIITIREDGIIANTDVNNTWYDFESFFNFKLKFIDGTPFGIKEEE